MFSGIYTALITPFKNEAVDMSAFENLVEWQIEQGIHGLVPCGTTGESPTLEYDEHKALIKRCVEIVNGRVPVIAGVGGNYTKKTIEMAQYAKQAGADAALAVAPYYNKPTQDGLFQHFKAINDAAALPIVVYNIPGRCIVDIQPETLARISKLEHVVGVKDSTGDLSRPTQTRLDCGNNFAQLSGEDATTAAFLAQGGHGAISVVSNVAPAEAAALYNHWKAGNIEAFEITRDRLHPLNKALFCESSPAPCKYAMSKLGFSTDELRQPLLPASQSARDMIDQALSDPDFNRQHTPKAAASHG